MSNQTIQRKNTGEAVIPDLPLFFDSVQRSNPFRRNRVSSVPAVADGPEFTDGAQALDEEFVDVPAIHRNEFRKLRRAINDVKNSGDAVGVVLSGHAGVGKSHLLARLCRTVETEKSGCFVFLHNVIASPERLPRHLLRSVISLLVEGRESYRDCKLYQLISRALRRTWEAAGRDPKQLNGLSASKARKMFADATSRLRLRSDPINSVVFDVLFSFFEHVNLHPRLTGPTREVVDSIVDWLSGDSISDQAAAKIGLASQIDDGEEAELVRLQDQNHIEQVLLILCQLCGMSDRVFLICLDQVDNLNEEQVQSLAQFLHTFLDHAENLVMITAGVTEKIKKFQETNAISVAQWDRIGQIEVPLLYSTGEEARDLIDARLKQLRFRFCELPELKTTFEEHAMFPIVEKEFEERFGDSVNIRLRSVLSWAGEAWQDQQNAIEDVGGPGWLKNWKIIVPPLPPPVHLEETIDKAVTKAVNEMIADRREHPGALPADADNLSTVTQKILDSCVEHGGYSVVGVSQIVPAKKVLPSYHLEVVERVHDSDRTVVNGVAFVTARNGNSARHALNRLLKVQKTLDYRILVTDDERCPLPSNALTKEHYSKLLGLKDGFRHIKLNFQLCAELDALRSVVDQAGDLEIEYPVGNYRPLTSAEVVQSLFRKKRLQEHPLLNELLVEPNDGGSGHRPPVPSPKLIETVIRGNLAFRVSITSNHVTTEILSRPEFQSLAFEAAHASVVATSEQLSVDGKFIVKQHQNGLLLMNMI